MYLRSRSGNSVTIAGIAVMDCGTNEIGCQGHGVGGGGNCISSETVLLTYRLSGSSYTGRYSTKLYVEGFGRLTSAIYPYLGPSGSNRD